MPYNHTAIEKKWQAYWLANKSFAALDPADAGNMPKAFVLDMFPYPSGAGLHVGHAEQQAATDILCRYLRMKGINVLHPMGWDAFGLPAEQYAIKNNVHPADTTRKNINKFREQIQSLGFGYDWDREVDTTDPKYYRWSQWIFLQLFNSYFDPQDNKAKPISHLINELENENLVVAPDGSVKVNPTQEGLEVIAGEVRVERLWTELTNDEKKDVIAGQRLAFMDEAPVNWCPGLGTVLANEEVIDGKSEVGGFPVERRPMRQWMLRISSYSDRLLNDLDTLQWPDSLKEMQRNWIGKSTGAEIDFEVLYEEEDSNPTTALDADDSGITVFTTRPDTLYGATYMVLAPEHPLVDRITSKTHQESVNAYRTMAAAKSDRDRMDSREKNGCFTGAYAINPINDEKLPIWIADYVLMGYGTGAIMAVPGHDDRDYEFAKKFDLPIKLVVGAADGSAIAAPFIGEGVAVNSPIINGLKTEDAKNKIIETLANDGVAVKTTKYKLRDWLFSRQRYWGEPFPILHDRGTGEIYALSETALPLTLPEVQDFRPRPFEGDANDVVPPLGRATEWQDVYGLVQPDGTVKVVPEGTTDARQFRRELNVMPQWAGSCWYYLRYIDPKNDTRFVDPEKEKYWMPVDLYVGGVEHAVLHLLYARFWHKILFDLGHVSTIEPFMRLVNQGIITGEMEYHAFHDGSVQVSAADLKDIDEEATDAGVQMYGIHKTTGKKVLGKRVTEDEVERSGNGYQLKSNRGVLVDARSFKMSKSRGNVVNPDDIVKDYGADAFRLYEMYMGPLEAQKPWNTRDIVGMSRFLGGVWNNLAKDDERPVAIEPIPVPADVERLMHKTIKKVGEDIEGLRFNTAIAELIVLNKSIGQLDVVPRELAENFVLMLAPFAPHIAEELWSRFGHTKSLARRPWPTFDDKKLVATTLEIPVQVNGKLRDKISVPADMDSADILFKAAATEKVKPWLEGKVIKKKLYVPKKLVNFVVGE